VRRELRLALHDPLDPWRLAKHLEIPVHKLSDLRTEVAHHFLHIERSAFSAVTVFRSNRRVIVHNDGHNAGRQASDISHELGHGLLLHRPAPALSVVGCRDWDPVLEEEADWLGAALLISDEAAPWPSPPRIATNDASAGSTSTASGRAPSSTSTRSPQRELSRHLVEVEEIRRGIRNATPPEKTFADLCDPE
jgi:hypothetical protein